ncbi:MAG: DUF2088 domain-containing protein [Planctomycetes bacterium]|nr:DUF2088 domain-containing protein [Planctomycetota bacterium]
MPAALTIPRMFLARQRFPRPAVKDSAQAVRSELAKLFPPGSIRPGAQIGVTVGSRGITGIARMARAAVDFLKERDARPFIIPAMGSHGGAAAEAQRALIAHYGVTEESMGAPIRDAMATRSLGRTPEGVEVFIAEAAWGSDGIVLMNRVKPHTDYKGRIESGLSKICAIGLGKYDGAQEYHSHIFDIGLGGAIEAAARKIFSTGKVLGGVAILENAYHETAKVEAVAVEGFFEHEQALLEEARKLMGSLPMKELDVLLCDRMGKNISGAGLDTNIIGRGVNGYLPGVPWQPWMPSILRIVVRDLSAESDGNGVGMGMVDFATKRFLKKVDHRITAINAVTACGPMNARTPVILKNDREALETAIRTCPRRPGGPLVAYVRDTLELEDVYLSEACLPLVEGKESIQVVSSPEPLRFDAEGDIESPFGAGVTPPASSKARSSSAPRPPQGP